VYIYTYTYIAGKRDVFRDKMLEVWFYQGLERNRET